MSKPKEMPVARAIYFVHLTGRNRTGAEPTGTVAHAVRHLISTHDHRNGENPRLVDLITEIRDANIGSEDLPTGGF